MSELYPRCGLCRHFEPSDQEPDYEAGAPWNGDCTRNPPQAIENGSRFPLVTEYQRCGEFVPVATKPDLDAAAKALAEAVLLKGDMTAAKALADRVQELASDATEGRAE